MFTSTIEARNLDQIHFALIRDVFRYGRVWVVGEGSYEGHKRLEFELAVFKVTHPHERPLAPQVPDGIPPPTTDEKIKAYQVKYLLDPTPEPNEVYNYSSYIAPQVPAVLDMLNRSGGDTNQATINVGGVESITQDHPPCLRVIDFRVHEHALHMYVYFRSWDLWGGLPENLGGLQMLKEDMAAALDLDDGALYGMSKGLHLYDFQWPVALQRIAAMPPGAVITTEEAAKGERWMGKQ